MAKEPADRGANDDATTVRRIVAGDREAFRELLDRHARPVFRTAHRLTGSAEDAEDVTQETFLRVYQKMSDFDGRSSLGTWIHRIAANCALDLLRERRRRAEDIAVPELPGDLETREPGPERRAGSRQLGFDLNTALATLTPLERDAFRLRHWEGFSTTSIAEALGLGREAAKQAVFRGVHKLRRSLGRDGGGR